MSTEVAAGASFNAQLLESRDCASVFHLKTEKQMYFSLCGCTITGENLKDFREQEADEEKSYLLLDLNLLNIKQIL